MRERKGERGPFPGCNLPPPPLQPRPPLSFSLNDFREGTHDEKYHPIINSAWARTFPSTLLLSPFKEILHEDFQTAILRLQAPPTVISSNIKSPRPGLPLAGSLPISLLSPSPLASPRYKAATADAERNALIATERRREGDPNAHAGRRGRKRGEGKVGGPAEAPLQPPSAPPFADFDIKKRGGGARS